MMIAALIISVLFLTCGSASTETAATFVVNVTQSSYQAEEKQNITLEWTFTTKTQGTWRKLFIVCSLLAPDKPRVIYQVHEGVEIPESRDDQFSGRVQSDKDVLSEGRIRLHVSRLRTEDSGLYLCDVKTEDGFNSGRCRLSVSVPVKVVGHDPIHAKVGDDVILPCHLKPPFDVSQLTMEWRFKGQRIHVQSSRIKDYEILDPKYINRTFMFPDELKKGNISLKLTKVTKEDEGNYICFVPKLQSQARKGNVTLILDENGSQRDSTDPGGTDPGVIAGVVVALIFFFTVIIIVVIIIKRSQIQRVLRHYRGEQNHRENVNLDDEAEGKPLQDQGKQNQSESST